MAQLVFDEEMAAQLEVFYRSRDVIRRRALVADALAAQPGDDVLDVGCGPGFYLEDLLEVVGDGSVTGVDASAAMLAVAKRKVGDRARLLEGTATKLPVEAQSFDRVFSVQVLEYVEDVSAALAELRRVLRPGGHLVLWDVDWSTVSWHSSDPARMARMLEAWDRHLADPLLPRTLAARLRDAGFTDVGREAHVFDTTAMDPETYGGTLAIIVRRYVQGLDDVDQSEADAWFADLQALEARGEYSAAMTQFCFTATRG
jgi:SAM-dependent methyltransferase